MKISRTLATSSTFRTTCRTHGYAECGMMCLFVTSQLFHATSFKRTPAFQVVHATYGYLRYAVINRCCSCQLFFKLLKKESVLLFKFISRGVKILFRICGLKSDDADINNTSYFRFQ